eukprot:IDg14099t1
MAARLPLRILLEFVPSPPPSPRLPPASPQQVEAATAQSTLVDTVQAMPAATAVTAVDVAEEQSEGDAVPPMTSEYVDPPELHIQQLPGPALGTAADAPHPLNGLSGIHVQDIEAIAGNPVPPTPADQNIVLIEPVAPRPERSKCSDYSELAEFILPPHM